MNDYPHIGYDLIVNIMPENSRILDLGCGFGDLLELLHKKKQIRGFGVELSEEGVAKCVEKGLYCYQGDIDEGLADYNDNSFDYVILNQTLQNTKHPDLVLNEIIRIGKKVIISFPNFAHFSPRFQLLIRGIMPKNKLLPYEWYESPNIHLLTIKDFQNFCAIHGIVIEKEIHFSIDNDCSCPKRIFPNLFAQYGFFVLRAE